MAHAGGLPAGGLSPLGRGEGERIIGRIDDMHAQAAQPARAEVNHLAPRARMINARRVGTHGGRADPEVPVEVGGRLLAVGVRAAVVSPVLVRPGVDPAYLADGA